MSLADGVFVSRHPFVRHKLALLRDRTTEPPSFRRLVHDLAQLLFIEATHDLRLEPWTVQTPLGECDGQRIAERIGLAPILRAGLGMADAILALVPWACVWHLGLYRDHDTLRPVTYYNKLPRDPVIDLALVVDPMLATGGSAVAAVTLLKEAGLRRIKFLGLIAAPKACRRYERPIPTYRSTWRRSTAISTSARTSCRASAMRVIDSSAHIKAIHPRRLRPEAGWPCRHRLRRGAIA